MTTRLRYAAQVAARFLCGLTGHTYRAWDACPALAMCEHCRHPYVALRGDDPM